MGKKIIEIEDLTNQEILILKRGYLEDVDCLRIDLLSKNPSIILEEFPFLNVDAFNRCVNENKLMIVIPEWKNIHPMLEIIPVEWDYTIPFGIMYSKKPSNDVQYFLNRIKELQPQG